MATAGADTLRVGGACAARELELDRRALAALPAASQVPDVGALAPGRVGAAVRLEALAELAGVRSARFVHVASLDGSFCANVAFERALEQGLVLYALDGSDLPARSGGPFRLLLVDAAGGGGEECSLNVKLLGSIAFLREPGPHTARCTGSDPGESQR